VPNHGLRLVVVAHHELEHDTRGRLTRNDRHDRSVLHRLLGP
jgi:hypothetical protein